MAHKCQFCDFTSERAYNLKRHTIRHHKIQEKDKTDNVKNTADFVRNPTDFVKNTADFVRNPTDFVRNEKSDYQCDKCGKQFTRAYGLTQHKCKGYHSLQCDICNEWFANRAAKHYHKKCGKCQPPQVTNNITNNNITNITNNNITNNVNIDKSVNINYISFNTKNNDPIEFHTDHIDDPKILKEIFAEPNFLDMFANYAEAVFAAKENQIVQKHNLSRYHAIVYLVDKKAYDYVLDTQIFYKFARGLSTSALVLSDKHRKKASLSNEHRECLRDIAIDCEASPCSTYDDEDLRYSKQTRKAIHIAKVKTHKQTMKNLHAGEEQDINIM